MVRDEQGKLQARAEVQASEDSFPKYINFDIKVWQTRGCRGSLRGGTGVRERV